MILYFAISYLVYEKPMYAQQAVANRKIDRQKMQIQYVGFLKMHAVKEVTPSPPTTSKMKLHPVSPPYVATNSAHSTHAPLSSL
jgi:hypothetical protein